MRYRRAARAPNSAITPIVTATTANLRFGLAVVAVTMGVIALFGARAARRYLTPR